MSKKLGRNQPCLCGSGKKYKYCCLTNNPSALENDLVSKQSIEKSQEQLKNRVKKNLGDKVILHQNELPIKMSEVILELADELLEMANTKKQYESVIMITVLAWNLATLESQTQSQEALESFLNKNVHDEQHKKDTLEIITALIKKKNLLFPYINRIIVDFQLVGNKKNFHLNVISTIPQNDTNYLE